MTVHQLASPHPHDSSADNPVNRDDAPASAPSTFFIVVLVVTIATALVDVHRVLLLLIPASFLLAAHGIGLLLERVSHGWMPPLSTQFPMLRLTARLGTGIAVIGLLTTILGQLGLYRTAGLLFFPAIAWSILNIVRNPPSFQSLRPSIPTTIGGTAIGIVWTIVWLWATIPSTFYDELAYHLPIAQAALRTGTIPANPWLFFTYMPHLSDLLLGWGLALAGDIGARALHVTFWIAIWIAGWALVDVLTASETTPWIAWLLAGMFASSAMFLFLGTLPFAETSLTFAVLASAALILGTSAQAAWIPVGLLWGLTLSVKLSGISWVIAAALAALVIGWPLSSLVRAGLLAFAMELPWWGRAWWMTGNPVYPLGHRWIGNRYWDDASQARLQGDLPSYSDFSNLQALLRLPLDMVLTPGRFGSASECGWLAMFAVCLMLTLPLWALFVKLDPAARRRCYAAGVFIVVAWSTWLLTSTTTRFLAPALMIGLCTFAVLLLKLPNRVLLSVLLALSAFGAAGTASFLTTHIQVFASDKVAIGQESGSAFAARTLDHYEAAQFVQQHLPSDANLLFIGESRPFYFDRSALAPYPFHQHPLFEWVQSASSSEALLDRIRQEGFTHVVLNTREFKRLHDTYGILAFSGPDGPHDDQRLRQLPKFMNTLFSKNSVYILEVPKRP